LSNKFKNGYEKFLPRKAFLSISEHHGFSISKQEVPKPWKPFRLQNLTIFVFVGQFFFQNVVFKLKEVFSEYGIRVFLENGLESFQTFFILQICDKSEVPKRFQKQF
jgi:hypothetical protein